MAFISFDLLAEYIMEDQSDWGWKYRHVDTNDKCFI